MQKREETTSCLLKLPIKVLMTQKTFLIVLRWLGMLCIIWIGTWKFLWKLNYALSMPILSWTFSGKNTSILKKNKALITWFSSRKRSITVLWKRLLLFECERVLKMKKVKNNRGLVQRYQWSWKIHVQDLRENTPYDKTEHRKWQFKL